VTPPATNYAEWKFYLDIVVLIGVIGNTWWSNREKVTSRRFAKLEEEVVKRATTAVTEALTQRTTEVETCLKNIPGNCTGHKDMTTRVDGHNDRLGQHKELIVKMEGEFKSLPKKDDLEAVYERVNNVSNQMADLRSEVGKISGALPGLTHITEMMNRFLLDQGGK
jgi:chromosome segregation ATPase